MACRHFHSCQHRSTEWTRDLHCVIPWQFWRVSCDSSLSQSVLLYFQSPPLQVPMFFAINPMGWHLFSCAKKATCISSASVQLEKDVFSPRNSRKWWSNLTCWNLAYFHRKEEEEEFRGLLMVSPDQYVPSLKNIKVLWLQLGHLKRNWILCGFQDASLDCFPKQDVTFLKPWTNRIILSSFQGSISPSGQVCYLFSHRCSSCYDREKYFFCLYFVHKNGQASLDHSISFIVFFPHLSLVI